MDIKKLDDVLTVLKTREKKRLVAAYANDDHTIEAVYNAIQEGIVEGTLVGDEATIKEVCARHNFDVSKFRIVQEADENKAGAVAVSLINKGEGDILMKGLLSTDKYMRAILNKETGLMPGPKAVLSHVSVFEIPLYHKLLVAGDVAIIKSLQIETPKVAVLAATEQMLPGMQACVDAAIIAKMSERGQIKGALVDGPLALDVAINKECAQTKKLTSPVAGDADCIVFPNIESGNVFYKSITKFGNGNLGAMVMGAKVPCVLTSRGDSAKSKMYSIALAALAAK